MNSNENTLQDTISQLNDYLEQSEASRWLADVFCIWDQDAHAWVPSTPFLIRTEERDVLLAWQDGVHMQVSTQPVDAYDVVQLEHLSPALAQAEHAASLCWRKRACLEHFIGSVITRFVLVPSSAGDELFIYFEDGQSIRVAPEEITARMRFAAA